MLQFGVLLKFNLAYLAGLPKLFHKRWFYFRLELIFATSAAALKKYYSFQKWPKVTPEKSSTRVETKSESLMQTVEAIF